MAGKVSGQAQDQNEDDAPDYHIMTPSGPQRNSKYILPNGEIVENEGEKHVRVKTKEGHRCMIKMQVTQVRKPLMSVGKVCDEGHRVIFEQQGGIYRRGEGVHGEEHLPLCPTHTPHLCIDPGQR